MAATDNGTIARSPFAGRRIHNYRRPYGRWLWHPALREGHFTRWDVPAMMQDNAVMIGLWAIFAPLQSAKWEVRANSREIKTFVENTLYRFWTHDLTKVLWHYVPWGTSIGEVLYEQDAESGLWKYAGLDDFDMNDVQALRRGRQLTGARVSYGSTILAGVVNSASLQTRDPRDPKHGQQYGPEWNTLRHPKIWWCGHRPTCGELYGKSVFESAWNPWMEKCGAHGAISIRKLWAFQNAFRGVVVKYPPGGTQRKSDGTIVDNQDVANEIAQNLSTGAAVALPSETDENGHPLWEIIDPKQNGEIKGLIEYPSELDKAIWQGMGVLDEVISAPDTGGSWSGRSGPLLIFLNIGDMRVREIITAFDVGPSGYTTRHEQAGGVIRPLVMENFGPKAKYEIRMISLVPKPPEPGAGGTPGPGGMGVGAAGGMPGEKPPSAPPMPSPMGGQPAPGPSGMGPPPQAMGQRPIKLSGAELGEVELPDAEVASILGEETMRLSSVFDGSKMPVVGSGQVEIPDPIVESILAGEDVNVVLDASDGAAYQRLLASLEELVGGTG